MTKRISLLTIVLILAVSMMVFAADPVQITILHTNDVHGRLTSSTVSGQDGEFYGFAKLYTLIKDVRQAEPNVILLDGGDILHGTNLVNMQKGLNMIAMMNLLGYNAMVPGNHDFNYGYQHLLTLSNYAKFDIVSANIEKDGELVMEPYTILTVDGVNVAVIGLSAPETPIVTHPANVAGLDFLAPVERAKQMVDAVKQQADVVVVLSHLGYGLDQTLAKEVEGIDVIIGGHSHTVLESLTEVNGVLIAQTGEHGKNLGRVDLTVQDGDIVAFNGQLTPVDNKVAKNPVVSAILKSYEAKLNAVMEQVVGSTDVELLGERKFVRTGETNLANLVTDVMLGACDADVAITNGGGIRASINKGEITIGEIYTVLPFDNTLVVIEITGAQLKAAMENGLAKAPAENGAFAQVAGMSVTYNASKPAGERVQSITIQGQPLDVNKLYHVATNDFMAAGGDGYSMFKEGKVVYSSGLYLRDLMVTYLQAQGSIAPVVEGRIVAQ